MGKESLDKERVKEIEFKEAEKLSPILLVYRDNDLFRGYVPEITGTLKSLGRQVEIQSFPAGIEEEEMEEWCRENEDKFEGMDIMTDETSAIALSNAGVVEHEDQKYGAYLDSLMDKATKRLIIGEREKEVPWHSEGDEEEKDMTLDKKLENAKEAYVTLIQKVFENKQNIPKEVYIVSLRLTDHEPFFKGFKGAGEEEDLKALELLKTWLVEAGISQDAVKEISQKEWYIIERAMKQRPLEENPKDFLEKINKQGNWILKDRHVYSSGEALNRSGQLSEEKALVLELPLQNFLQGVMSAGLIKIKPGELDEEVKKLLKEKFTTEEE